MSSSQSDFVWYELLTTEPEKAESFYSDVFGWNARDAGMPDMRYTLLSASDADIGGVMELPAELCDAGGKPGWVGYVGVEDVDAAAAKVAQDGGTIHRDPDDIPGVGRFAVAADPQGAAFCLFSTASEGTNAARSMKTGHIGWNELHSTDWKSGFDFYEKQFGWRKSEALDMGPMGTYQIFNAGKDDLGGMLDDKEFPHPAWLYYVSVDDIDATLKRVTDKGGKLLYGPSEVPGGMWIINALDPQGAMFAAVGPRPNKGD
ncbi:VOC family protein [Sphingomonas cavernae]|uniref:VOC family protein n=1 Tax=Sphingomonas cavernae TaxID=2320861 RepID=A0A418WLX2_9SPHN|nr:VOC family protein [Sphingomonas cavernae]RJF90997.1 VOC family protein [Sphingomonas cavernae]